MSWKKKIFLCNFTGLVNKQSEFYGFRFKFNEAVQLIKLIK